ncbi:MAG: hypothetical protein A2138_22190 [Deltaproteobacteria bacterium RBG_16_71_12]|nr:MAG: hypothetical protein A2138_22190 [Deltaproteobacteria bacterium RBG_16_71_12]
MLVLALLCAACGAPVTDGADDANAADAAPTPTPVVLDLDAEQLDVARLDIDLDVNIARFLAPPDELPLDNVFLTADGYPAESLVGDIYSCFEHHGDELAGGGFIVMSIEEDPFEASTADCLPCGLALICPGVHEELGPGAVPDRHASSTDVDPADGDDPCGTGDSTGDSSGGSTGGSSGGSTSGSSGGSTSSGSGAGTGGSGGSSGGAGNPGWD